MKVDRPDQGQVSILVVDDEASILELLGEYLRARGHEVETAHDGPRALDRLETLHPDVVLSDMKMPGMSGLELLARIRERPVPVATILMTGYGTIDSAIQAMKDGAHDYLLKPFKLREVHAAITRAVERIRQERETVRLRQIVALYQAVHALKEPQGLVDIYALLCEVAQQEFSGEAALIAFYERRTGEWEEYHRTHRAPFTGLDLQTLGDQVRDRVPRTDCWFGDRQDPVLAAPIPAQLSADGSTQLVGLIAVANAQLQSQEAAQALEVYSSVVGDALSRQILSARLRIPPEGGEPDVGGLAQARPGEHAQRVRKLVERTAAAVGLSPDQVQTAAAAAQLHDHTRLGISLADLVSGANLESHSGSDPDVSPDQLADLSSILLDIHEHIDGCGSPRGRTGDAIHPIAQLITIANQWDMLTTTRTFAPLLTPRQAAENLRAQSGSVFRTDVLESFIDVMGTSG